MGVKILSPMSGSPIWWSGNGRRRRKRIWLWKPGGLDSRASTGLGETESPLLDGTQKVSGTPGSRGRKQWPHKSLGQTYLLILEGLLQRRGVAVAPCGYKHWWRQFWEVFHWIKPSWRPPFSHPDRPTQQPVGSSAGTAQAKPPTGWEHSLPNCRQAA